MQSRAENVLNRFLCWSHRNATNIILLCQLTEQASAFHDQSGYLITLYLWQWAGLVLCPPLVGQLGWYWRVEGQLLLAGAETQNRIRKKDHHTMQTICIKSYFICLCVCVCGRSWYLFGGGVWASVSCVVGRGPQVYFPRRDPSPFACCRCLCCLDYVNTLGGNSLLFIFELFSRLAIVRWATPVLLVVTVVETTGRVRRAVMRGQRKYILYLSGKKKKHNFSKPAEMKACCDLLYMFLSLSVY